MAGKDKKNIYVKFMPSLLIAVAIYALVQGIGLWISYTGPGGGDGLIGQINSGAIPPVIPGETANSAAPLEIFLYVLISTAIILILLRYKFDLVIGIILAIGLLGGLFITLTSLIGDAGIIIAIPLFLLGLWKRNNIVIIDTILILSIPGIGAWIGASPALGALNTLILLIALAVYDIVAVFGTKHMVTLAKGVKGRIPLMFAIPVGDRILGLGTGDLAIPLVFTVAILRDYTMTHAIIASIGGLLGLVSLFLYIIKKKDVVLPALPPIAAGLIVGFGAGFLIP